MPRLCNALQGMAAQSCVDRPVLDPTVVALAQTLIANTSAPNVVHTTLSHSLLHVCTVAKLEMYIQGRVSKTHETQLLARSAACLHNYLSIAPAGLTYSNYGLHANPRPRCLGKYPERTIQVQAT